MSNQDQEQQQVKTDPNAKVKLARDPRVLTILEFIKKNDGITMDRVAKYMNDKGLCSRPTTRLLLFSLKQEGILVEKERRNKYFHDLVVNEEYPFEALLQEVFAFHAEEINKSLKPFETILEDKDKQVKIETKHYVDKKSKALTELGLKSFVFKLGPKDLLTSEEGQQFENNIEKKMMEITDRRLLEKWDREAKDKGKKKSSAPSKKK